MRTTKLLNALLLMAATALAACQHDDGEALLTLRGENLCRPQKMTVVDSTASWNQGDTVWINGERCTVSIDGEGRATTRVRRADSYSAIFPASIVTNDNNVRLPHEYHYSSDVQGRQQIDLPMMASSEGEGLDFFHLTGAVMVKFVNHRSETVTVDRITVKSDAFALSGNRPIDFADTAQAPLPIASPTDSSVTVLFDRHPVQVAFDDTLAVLVPVAPVGNTNHFTVEVVTHIDGRRYTIRNTQRNAHPNPRNALAYAYMWLTDTCRSFSLFHEDGNGANRTMHISSASDFLLFQQAINNGWTHDGNPYSTFKYTIDANIDMSGCEIEPINGFTGTSFNGNGHTISNLTISSANTYCTLFDTIRASGTTISNLTFDNVVINCIGSTPTRYISPLIGRLSTACTISNCTISVSRINTSTIENIYYGGIIATNGSNATITNCQIENVFSLTSNNKVYFGGIVGQANANVTCSNCKIYNNGININAGGIIYSGGAIGDGSTKSHSLSDVNCTDSITTHTDSDYTYCGGLIGWMHRTISSANIILSNCNISGKLAASTNGDKQLYIGTIYGYGNYSYKYGFRSSSYSHNLQYPPSGGLIISGDPTGTY